MPARTQYPLEARLSEVGEDGEVFPYRILEWMQEAAARASTLGGFPAERYAAMGAAWFIREVQLVLDSPIRVDDAVTIETWVSDLRRFRSRREYLITARDGRVAARGQADWMFLELDQATGRVRPRHPDEEMKAVFPRVDAQVIKPEEVEPWPEGTSEAFEALPDDERIVRPSEIDRYGHVNHTGYLRWLDDHLRTCLPDARMAFVRLQYRVDARPGDKVRLELARQGAHLRQGVDRGDQQLLRAVSRLRV